MQSTSLEKTSLYIDRANLRAMTDAELLVSTQRTAHAEREVLVVVLRHLAEVERRKLYCDVRTSSGLRYPSLFEYAVRELKYSESAAGRRIQAMRLIREFPELEAKLESGALNLMTICQAQSFFRQAKFSGQALGGGPSVESHPVGSEVFGQSAVTVGLSVAEKRDVLQKLEQKTSREGEKLLIAMNPAHALPKERERVVNDELTELRFLADKQLKESLAAVRALLGPKGATLSLAELVRMMATHSVEKLENERFGKKRMQATRIQETISTPSAGSGTSTGRCIPRATRYSVWQQAGGKCVACGSQQNLQFDHLRPVALGGESTPDNLQLLCGSCNLRRGVKTFGAEAMRR